MESLRHAAAILGRRRHRTNPRHLAGAGSPRSCPGHRSDATAEKPVARWPRANPEAVHLLAEAGRLAFADRGLYVADADFVPVPVAGLVAPDYLAKRAALIGARSVGIAKPGVPAGIRWPTHRIDRRCAFPHRKWWRWMTSAAPCR